MSRFSSLNAQDLIALRASGKEFSLIDVREQGDWNDGHLPEATHLPLGSIEFYAPRLFPDRTKPLVVYCMTHKRSMLAAELLERLGYTNVSYLEEGYLGATES
ncbi:rhodanese-like domain-containing protein [Patescibacteria group bacterium]|nr:rhodanese-like domain-containing protein [Patescibacteria group bacterium]